MKETAKPDLSARLRRTPGRAGRTKVISFKVTPKERHLIEEAARATDKAAAEWAREVLLREAGQGVPERAIFTELIALRQQVAAMFAQIATGKTMTCEAYEKMTADLRLSKHRTAREVLEQYTITGGE